MTSFFLFLGFFVWALVGLALGWTAKRFHQLDQFMTLTVIFWPIVLTGVILWVLFCEVAAAILHLWRALRLRLFGRGEP